MRIGLACRRPLRDRFDSENDCLIERTGNAQNFGFAEERAVERIDLGRLPLFDMLEHGGAVVALPGMIENRLARVWLGKGEALRRDDGHDLIEHALEEPAGGL